MTMINTRERFVKEAKNLQQELQLANPHLVPRISKVTVSAGIGRLRQDKDMLSYTTKALTQITGQKPITTTAKKAIAGFKVRAGEPVGLKVTLRGRRMDDFLNRLVNIILPRIRDFRGIDPVWLDRLGNLTIGFRDQGSFVETGAEAFDRPFGLAITISIAHSDQHKSTALLQKLGFPVKVQ